MRVLFACPSYQYGGGEVYLSNLINEIYETETELLLSLISVNSRVISDCKIDDKHFVPSINNSILSKLKFVFHVIAAVNNKCVDVVFCNGYSELGRYAFLIKLFSSVNVVSIGHSNEVHFLKNNVGFFKNIKRFIDSYLVSFLDGFIVINKKAESSLLETKLQPTKIKLIYNGVPEIKRDHVNYNNRESTIIGRNCRMIDKKGVDNLILASKILVDRGCKNFKINLAGDGEKYNDYIALAKEFNVFGDVINFMGHVDKEVFYNSIDALILTTDHKSNADATPLVILEAMSAEIPIITTTVGGVMELVDKDSAFILDDNSPEEIADKIEFLLKNKNFNNDFLVNAKNKYNTRFTVKVMANNTVCFLKNIGE